MFYAGMSANKQELVFSAPFIENSFSIAIGAGSIKVDDEITGLKVFEKIYLYSVKIEYLNYQGLLKQPFQ